MTRSHLVLLIGALLMISSITSLAAQITPKQKKARAKLESYDIPFTADAFLSYVDQKNYEVVERFIDAGMDIGIADSRGDRAVIVAAQKGSLKMLELLVKHKADLNVTDADGSTALMYAAHFRQHKTAKYLVKKGADSNIQNNSKMTALMYAVLAGCIDTIDAVLVKDTDVSLKNNQNQTAISLARDEGFISVANFIKSKLDYLNNTQEKKNVELEIQLKKNKE